MVRVLSVAWLCPLCCEAIPAHHEPNCCDGFTTTHGLGVLVPIAVMHRACLTPGSDGCQDPCIPFQLIFWKNHHELTIHKPMINHHKSIIKHDSPRLSTTKHDGSIFSKCSCLSFSKVFKPYINSWVNCQPSSLVDHSH